MSRKVARHGLMSIAMTSTAAVAMSAESAASELIAAASPAGVLPAIAWSDVIASGGIASM